jgi:hypothetical protein
LTNTNLCGYSLKFFYFPYKSFWKKKSQIFWHLFKKSFYAKSAIYLE